MNQLRVCKELRLRAYEIENHTHANGKETNTKIAYVLDAFPKLSESFIIGEIAEIINLGHDVKIFSLNHPRETIFHREVAENELLSSTCNFSFKNVFKNLWRFLINFSKVISLGEINFSVNGLVDSIKVAYFALELKDRTLIHSHFAFTGQFVRKLSKVANIPFTLTTHAVDIFVKPDADRLIKIVSDSNAMITISNYNRKYLEGLTGLRNKIVVIRCGVDLQKFVPSERFNRDGKIRVLTVSRLVEKKGLRYLIRAMKIVVANLSCELNIVGSGPQHAELLQLVHKLGLDDHVHFRGNMENSELIEYYKNADIFVLPCIVSDDGDRDGIPVSIMEAMAMKLPVISTIVSGIPELVRTGCGFLIPEKDVLRLAEAIEELCRDKNLRISMGESGRKVVTEDYDLKIQSRKLSDLFEKIAEDT